MSCTSSKSRVHLHEAEARAVAARHIVNGISLAIPGLAGLCRAVSGSVNDVPALASEVRCLRRDLARTRLGRANLAAASRATMSACRNGESDPLSYLRDELDAQGYGHQGYGDQRRPA